MTRRLVDVSQDIIVKEEDCGTENGFVVKTFVNDKNLTCQRLIGTRYTWDDKSVVIPIKRYYYSGFAVLKKMPDDF